MANSRQLWEAAPTGGADVADVSSDEFIMRVGSGLCKGLNWSTLLCSCA